MRFVVLPVGLVMVRASCLFATELNIVSNTTVHIDGAAHLPCPIPRIILILFVTYSLAKMQCPVFTLNVVLASTLVNTCTAVLDMPKRLQQNME